MREDDFMRSALTLAKRGLGTTSPNPMVGTLVVKGQRVLGKGYHRKAGQPHAEVLALDEAGNAAQGAIMYVNLEPCCHMGRTPPCVDRIIRAGIKKVVVGMLDPNPLVNGQGVEALKKAGIEVKVGVLEGEARRLNEAFVGFKEKKRPFFTLKAASSLDGKIATKIGESKWISNEESRAYASKLRSVHDAILVGINTVILDNPMLVPRIARPKRYPVRVILDSKLRIPLTCQVVKTGDKYKTWIFTLPESRQDKEQRLRSMGVDVIRVPAGENGRISLAAVCEELFKRDIVSVLIEGGGEVNSSFLKEGFLDKIVLFYAPKFIGGKGASSMVSGKGIDFLKDAYRVDIVSVKRFKEDLCVEGYVHRDH
jgi:diaminohydroxyphosphoribosylaminopyrimidine deaminase / 5-amino-6-(5-phosphoribosylamino)uracil reductase